MAPTLLEGDWLLVDPDAYRDALPRVGELVVAASGDGFVVKRVAASSAYDGVALSGDAPSTEGHAHDLIVDASALAGRPWLRYWPPRRMGRIR
jgi:hypothetical protein